jgi:hypothetical protein
MLLLVTGDLLIAALCPSLQASPGVACPRERIGNKRSLRRKKDYRRRSKQELAAARAAQAGAEVTMLFYTDIKI